ncbi:lipopolysaccharide biosynthesis protein [Leeia oryzae]|uniref:lipopolysaccharide biosynthesis protein n=1 Tax=Leeia oryzae TaxID=356662 RepID=UPI0003625F0C|nr:oligosaccharide flippase family protein [Leeia oryzae]
MKLSLRKIKAAFSTSETVRDVMILIFGTAIAQGITIIATPLLSRLYTPSDFGVLAVFLAVVGVSATLITLRYETAVLIPKEDIEAANLVLLCLTLASGSATLLCLLSLFLPITLQEALHLTPLKGWLPFSFVVAGATAVTITVQGLLNRQRKYTQISKLRVVQSVGIAGVGLLFGYLPNHEYGLVLAQTIVCFCIALAALWMVRSELKTWKQQRLFAVAYTHQNAPKYLLPAALLDVVTLQMPVILISAWFGENMAGQFNMAWRLLMLPIVLVGSAVGQVFMQRLSIVKHDPAAAKKIIRKTWLLLMALGFLPLLTIFLYGESIFSIVLGGNWQKSGNLASLMAPMVLAMFISSPTSGTYIIFGLQRFNLLFGILTAIYRPACLWIGKIFNSLEIAIILWNLLDIFTIILYQTFTWKKLTQLSEYKQ